MNLIVACTNMKRELTHVLQQEGCDYPVLWIDSKYHDLPDKLHNVLQETLDSVSNVEHVLLSFGFCGNALVGVQPHGFKLVFPQIDDCITLLIGSTKRRKELEPRSYFFTEGWMSNGKSILTEYADTIALYGQESADYVYDFILEGYQNALLVDIGLGDMEALRAKTADFSEKFHLQQQVVQGDLCLLRRLIAGDWTQDFVVLEPEECVRHEHLFGKMGENCKTCESLQQK